MKFYVYIKKGKGWILL